MWETWSLGASARRWLWRSKLARLTVAGAGGALGFYAQPQQQPSPPQQQRLRCSKSKSLGQSVSQRERAERAADEFTSNDTARVCVCVSVQMCECVCAWRCRLPDAAATINKCNDTQIFRFVSMLKCLFYVTLFAKFFSHKMADMKS